MLSLQQMPHPLNLFHQLPKMTQSISADGTSHNLFNNIQSFRCMGQDFNGNSKFTYTTERDGHQ
jgi:hypothetical protein